MKLRNKLAAITAAAMLAFTGVGFAAWAFTSEQATQTTTIDTGVHCAVELSDGFKLKNDGVEVTDLYLIFDAPASGNTHVVQGGHGVYWSTTNDNTAWTNRVDGNVLTIEGTLNYAANEVEDLSSITVSFVDNGSVLTANSYITFGAVTVPSAITINDFSSNAVVSGQFALPTVNYTSEVNNISTVAQASAIDSGVAASLCYKAYISAITLA